MSTVGIELRLTDLDAADRLWQMRVGEALEAVERGTLVDPARRLADWMDEPGFEEVRKPPRGALLRTLDDLVRRGDRPLREALHAGRPPGVLTRLDRWFSSIFEGAREPEEVEFDKHLLGYLCYGAVADLAQDALELVRALRYRDRHPHGFTAFLVEAASEPYEQALREIEPDVDAAARRAGVTLIDPPAQVQETLARLLRVYDHGRKERLAPHPVVPRTFTTLKRDPLLEKRRLARVPGAGAAA